jgi:hypothetical protein
MSSTQTLLTLRLTLTRSADQAALWPSGRFALSPGSGDMTNASATPCGLSSERVPATIASAEDDLIASTLLVRLLQTHVP